MAHNISHPIGGNLKYNLPAILEMADLIHAKNYENLGLICTGSSGAIIAGIIASYLPETPRVIYIRKPGEDGHVHWTKDDLHSCKTLVLVDDFVCSGDTVNRVINKLEYYGIHSIQALCINRFIGDVNSWDFFKEYLVSQTDNEEECCPETIELDSNELVPGTQSTITSILFSENF